MKKGRNLHVWRSGCFFIFLPRRLSWKLQIIFKSVWRDGIYHDISLEWGYHTYNQSRKAIQNCLLSGKCSDPCILAFFNFSENIQECILKIHRSLYVLILIASNASGRAYHCCHTRIDPWTFYTTGKCSINWPMDKYNPKTKFIQWIMYLTVCTLNYRWPVRPFEFQFIRFVMFISQALYWTSTVMLAWSSDNWNDHVFL